MAEIKTNANVLTYIPGALVSSVGSIINLIRATKSDGSLIEFTKPARVEPVAILDKEVLLAPFLPDVLKSMTYLFSAYYLQGVQFQINIGKIDILRVLSAVNPDRSISDSALALAGGSLMVSGESYERYFVTLEGMTGHDLHDRQVADYHPVSASEVTKETQGVLIQHNNLMTGLVLAVTMQDGNQSATVNVTVALRPMELDSDLLAYIYSEAAENRTNKERIHGFKAGTLTMGDMILCNDVIDSYRRARIKDDTGMMAEIKRRASRNAMAGLLSATPSVATASNIAIISKETQDKIEFSVGGKLSNFDIRQRIFIRSELMFIIVIDRQFEMCTVYTRNQALPTKMSAHDMKMSSGKSGVDVAEMMKLYTLGKPPVF